MTSQPSITPYAKGSREPSPVTDSKQLAPLFEMTILVVDDSVEHLEMVTTALRENGFCRVVRAQDETAAIHHLQQATLDGKCAIDLVLIDAVIAARANFDFCRQKQNIDEWRNIPVVVLAQLAHWNEETAYRSFVAGVDDMVFKPACRPELLARILSSLTLKKERDLRRLREEELQTELAERRIIETRLQYLVTHDDLTGLGNIRRLEQALELAIIQARVQQRCGVLLYVDLDQFKVINNLEGHAAGDRLLVMIANQLRRLVRGEDVLARVSSDEYAILMENISEQEAVELAESIRRTLDEFQFTCDGRTYHVGASIGISVIRPDEKVTASETLARADQACYVAKTHGRNLIHLFDREDEEMRIHRRSAHWVPIVRRALANNGFRLLFQPVLNLANNRIEHYEALIRLVDDQGQLVSPGAFIPIAERMGLIHEIDRWVVNRALAILAELPPDHNHLSLHINLSGHAFQDPELFALARKQAATSEINVNRIVFEITETAAISNFEQTRGMVVQLRNLGYRFALDDFGAGFNSFNYIKHFPVDYLKIDGAFIVNLANDSTDQSLVKSMIDIAHCLNIKTVAEFVENQETLDLLRSYGVDYGQGFYIGRPAGRLGNVQIVKDLDIT